MKNPGSLTMRASISDMSALAPGLEVAILDAVASYIERVMDDERPLGKSYVPGLLARRKGLFKLQDLAGEAAVTGPRFLLMGEVDHRLRLVEVSQIWLHKSLYYHRIGVGVLSIVRQLATPHGYALHEVSMVSREYNRMLRRGAKALGPDRVEVTAETSLA